MTRKQYAQANKRVFYTMMVELFVIVISMLWMVWNGDGKATVVVAVAAVSMVVNTVEYIREKDTKRCAIILALMPSVTYVVFMMVMIASPYVYVYAFPIILSVITYLNMRFLFAGNTIILITNAIQLIVRIRSAEEISGSVFNSLFIQTVVVMLMLYTSVTVAKLIIRFEAENKAVINAASEKQAETNRTMAIVAENLLKHFEESDSVLKSLNSSIDVNNFSMQNIADSTESTADAIQSQAEMCMDIQKETEAAVTEAAEMTEASQRTIETVQEGTAIVEDLRNQAKNVREASEVTVEATRRLTSSVGEVQSILSAITQISSQTNLLALNASIEAARAGEAGRGFAVVAEEIRQLSEQTKGATDKIGEIIKSLIEDAQSAMNSIDRSAASVEQQNQMIGITQDKFSIIRTEVSQLTNMIHTMEGVIQNITGSSNSINESISHLSASSEEVAASSSEGVKTASEASRYMKQFSGILEGIRILAEDLKNTMKQ